MDHLGCVTFTMLLLCSCSSSMAESKLQRARENRVPNSYFVHFTIETTADAAGSLIDELRQLDHDSKHFNFSVSIRGVISKTGHGFAAIMSQEALNYVLRQSVVELVEEDSYMLANQLGDAVSTTNRAVGSWGIDRMDSKTSQYDGRYTPPCGLTGQGVDVYVVDSGLNYDHLQFGQRASGFSGSDAIDLLSNGSATNNGRDCNGHGTLVGGVIGSRLIGVAPGANLLSVRVLDCEGKGPVSAVLLGLESILSRVQENKGRPAVVNLSLTGASKVTSLQRAIDRLIDNGISVVGISGNTVHDRSGNACKYAPGSIPGVITVAGTTKNDEVFNHTMLGKCVHILAPAKDITSTGFNCRDCTVSSLQGSSFAAPHVTGAIALLLQKCPKLPPWKVMYYLQTKMAVADTINFKGVVTSKYRITSPNLLIHTGPEMCTLEC